MTSLWSTAATYFGSAATFPFWAGFFKRLDYCRVYFCQLTFNISRCFNFTKPQANLCIEFLFIRIPVGMFNITSSNRRSFMLFRVHCISLWSENVSSDLTRQLSIFLSKGLDTNVTSITACLFPTLKVGSQPWFTTSRSVDTRYPTRTDLLLLQSLLPHQRWWAFVSHPSMCEMFLLSQYCTNCSISSRGGLTSMGI